MSLYSRLKLRTRRLADDTSGSMPVEGLLASTFLIWWYIASFQFFDAYRQKNINLKAAYTIADMISRVQPDQAIDSDYIEGLNTLFDYLTFSRKPTWVRVSSVIWDDTADRYEIAWSYATGSTGGQTDDSIQADKNRIPIMPAGDSVILVETNMAYEPIFNIGLKAQWYTTFITTRPRFTSCVKYDLKDGVTLPACIYDSDVDMTDNVSDDNTTDPSIGL
ncbi:TadE/TadG family type IV pilus assembly protein [Defluviimonas sp. SAOS-178_SWC]|uniref:TadE/TadG family type IV pilus assembly protein n=1 Tax=Defluviimonas sp. SAOS-178_SWC TaxID=3121287 RepID=UPI003221980D